MENSFLIQNNVHTHNMTSSNSKKYINPKKSVHRTESEYESVENVLFHTIYRLIDDEGQWTLMIVWNILQIMGEKCGDESEQI